MLRILTRNIAILVIASLFLGGFTPVSAEGTSVRLIGKTGRSPDRNAGYIDLSPPVDFQKGDKLRISVGGTASRVVVRLLPRGFAPTEHDIIVEQKGEVSKSRTVDVVLTSDYKDIVQISVHGGPSPWNEFPLGEDNGPAMLLQVERLRP
jgi:hypothetical protein